MAETLVELIAVRRSYRFGDSVVNALDGLDFTIEKGSFVGIIGRSGSGKSTLLNILGGLDRPTRGEVLVEGTSIQTHPPKIGYVPQLEAIDWNFPVTVEQVVMMGCTSANPLFPWFRKSEKDRAYEIIERLGIADLRDRHIRELSGGQQQRAFLARALVSSPRLLLLDEPTSGVDIKTRDEVMHLLDELNHQDITIVMTTHEINAVAAHLPWIVCLNGHIVAEGPPSEIFTPEIRKGHITRTFTLPNTRA